MQFVNGGKLYNNLHNKFAHNLDSVLSSRKLGPKLISNRLSKDPKRAQGGASYKVLITARLFE